MYATELTKEALNTNSMKVNAHSTHSVATLLAVHLFLVTKALQEYGQVNSYTLHLANIPLQHHTDDHSC